MRAAATEARGVLVDLASAKLGVPASRLEVRMALFKDTKIRERVSYAELAKS